MLEILKIYLHRDILYSCCEKKCYKSFVIKQCQAPIKCFKSVRQSSYKKEVRCPAKQDPGVWFKSHTPFF